MPRMVEASVDAVITDPPYGIASPTKVQKRGNNELMTFTLDWDTALPLGWIGLVVRLMKPGASIIAFTGSNEPGVLRTAMREAGLHPLQNVYWRKTNPPPQPRKNFCSAVEVAVFARKPGRVLFWGGGGTTHNVFEAPIVGGYERTGHPTQKPLSLMRWLCRLVTPPGGLVLDPFAGSGSTLVAALQEGFSAIGIEKEHEYVEIARKRLDNTQLALAV